MTTENAIQPSKEQEEAVHLSVIKKSYELLTAAFSFVAALAWNDAIQSLFLRIFGPTSTIFAKFLYAILITVIIVYMGMKLAKLNKLVENKLKKPQP